MNNYKKLTIIFILSISLLSISMIENWVNNISLFYIEIYNLGLVPIYITIILRAIGNLAFPIISYLLVMDIKHKSNFKKHLIYLGLLSVFSQFFYMQVYYPPIDDINNISFLFNTNLFYTLFLGTACILTYEKLNLKRKKVLALIPIFFTPLGFFVPLDLFTVNFMPIYMTVLLILVNIIIHFLPNDYNKNKTFITLKSFICPFLIVLSFSILAGNPSTFFGEMGIVFIFCLHITSTKPKINQFKTLLLLTTLFYLPFFYYILSFILRGDPLYQHLFVLMYTIPSLIFIFISIFIIYKLDIDEITINNNLVPKVILNAFYPIHLVLVYIIF